MKIFKNFANYAYFIKHSNPKKLWVQGPRSNFEIGGSGGTISDSILRGTRHFFLLNLYNFHPPPLPLLRGPSGWGHFHPLTFFQLSCRFCEIAPPPPPQKKKGLQELQEVILKTKYFDAYQYATHITLL